MRVLVIGRTGQLARALAERAGDHGVTLTAAGRGEADLTDEGALAAALDAAAPDAAINAAAYTAVDAAETDVAAAHALNAAGPSALARLCAARGVPLIHVSTDYVFDGRASRAYREDDPIAPQTVYGRTKADGEAGVLLAGGPAIVARTAWVYSPFGANFVKTMLRLGASRPELGIVADQHGNPTSALDLADALLALLRERDIWPSSPQILHVAGRGDATWYTFAKAIFEAAGLTPTVRALSTADYPTPAQRPANSRLDTSLLAERYAITLPSWTESLPGVVTRILKESATAP